MFGSLNKVELIGSLGADPEIKSFQNGGRIANLRVACSESWKDKSTGERKERTEWISVSVQAEGLIGLVERFLKKGSKVYVEGKFTTRKWQDRDGVDRYSTEVVIRPYAGTILKLDKSDSGSSSGGGQGRDNRDNQGGDWGRSGGGSAGGSGAGGPPNGGAWADDLDDDIPF